RLGYVLLVGKALAVGQDMRGNEIDRGREFRVFEPYVPDFTCRNRDIDRTLDALDELDQVVDLLFATVNGFVADDDAVDVAIVLGQIDRGLDLALVAIHILIDPGADRDLYAGLIGDRRNQFNATGG